MFSFVHLPTFHPVGQTILYLMCVGMRQSGSAGWFLSEEEEMKFAECVCAHGWDLSVAVDEYLGQIRGLISIK